MPYEIIFPELNFSSKNGGEWVNSGKFNEFNQNPDLREMYVDGWTIYEKGLFKAKGSEVGVETTFKLKWENEETDQKNHKKLLKSAKTLFSNIKEKTKILSNTKK